jgi:hypothetical protein
MQGSLITASKSESVKVNAGEPARAWQPRHVHGRSLKVRSEVCRAVWNGLPCNGLPTNLDVGSPQLPFVRANEGRALKRHLEPSQQMPQWDVELHLIG